MELRAAVAWLTAPPAADVTAPAADVTAPAADVTAPAAEVTAAAAEETIFELVAVDDTAEEEVVAPGQPP